MKIKQKLIKKKRKRLLHKKVREIIGNPNDIWKSLKSLGLPSKITPIAQISVKDGGKISFNEKSNKNSLKNFYVN